MQGQTAGKGKANVRLAIFLGVVAFGLFLTGMYMAMNKAG
jgi:hypothetical protein